MTKLIDLHADTITALYYDLDNYQAEQEFILASPRQNLVNNSLHIDIAKLKQADSLAQFFVLWLNIKACLKYQVSPWVHFVKLYDTFRQQIEVNSSTIDFVDSLAGINSAHAQNKFSGLVCVEEGGFISSMAQLEQAYRMGVRYITLVWNYETHIGVPSCIDQSRGLKPFGVEMVQKMQELGMLVDVSHLSDRGVSDVLQLAKKPIIASHSNARALCSHTRNLPDGLIRGIANNGGVIGVNCVPYFLHDTDKAISLENVVAHYRYIYNLAGIDVLAVGNDFDGFVGDNPAADQIKSIADLPKLADALVKSGFTTNQVEQIFSKNVLRVLRDSL